MLPQVPGCLVHFRSQLSYKFYRKLSAYAHKTYFKMNKVYFRNSPGSTELQISFRYKNPTLNVDREFNFCRNVNENVDDALVRIRNNIEKEFNKKLNKKQKKTKPNPDNQEDAPKPSGVKDVAVDFIRSNEKLASITFAKMIENTNDLVLQVLDERFDVVLNTPWVCNVVLPQSILAGFILYPRKIEMQFADREHSIGTWYKGKMPTSGNIQQVEWAKCGSGFSYQTTTDDIGHHIKFELQPGNASNLGPVVDVIGKNPVEAGPGRCPFEDRHVFTQNCLKGDKFRVISYNILADMYTDSDYSRTVLFPYCPPYALGMDYRKQLFVKEILGYNGDVICLQEVDVKIFDLDLQPILGEKGFSGHMQQKGNVGEGIATFYRNDRFEFVRTSGVLIGANIKTLPIFRSIWEKIQDNTKLVERIIELPTTLQLTILKSKDTNKYLLVANIHLYFHPDADHIRLLQAGLSMLYIENIYKQLANEMEIVEDDICLIFCGDFNSVPECGIYKLMTEKFVGSDFIDWSSNAEEAVKDVTLSQPFSIASACGTPKYTNFTQGFAACLDYIFYQTEKLSVEEVIPLPSDEELKAHVALPSVIFPSDHVALVSDLKFKQ